MDERPQRYAGVGAGFAWLLLIPAAELQRRGMLSYDGYNRLIAVPLLLFVIALWRAPGAVTGEAKHGAAGLRIAAGGAALLWVGNVVEFYGVLLQSGLNAQAAHDAGETEHWIGSDIGWIIFGLGMLTVLVGGIVAAIGLQRSRDCPRWVTLFAATLGIGVLAGNLFGLAPAFLSVPVLGSYAAGWIFFGVFLLGSRTRQRSGARAPSDEPAMD